MFWNYSFQGVYGRVSGSADSKRVSELGRKMELTDQSQKPHAQDRRVGHPQNTGTKEEGTLLNVRATRLSLLRGSLVRWAQADTRERARNWGRAEDRRVGRRWLERFAIV